MELYNEVMNGKFDYNCSYDLDDDDFSFYEHLSNAFPELHDGMILLCKKIIELKRKIASSTSEVKSFESKENKQNWSLRIRKMRMES